MKTIQLTDDQVACIRSYLRMAEEETREEEDEEGAEAEADRIGDTLIALDAAPTHWTVIGYYEDNNQAWADSYEAATWEEARAAAHADHPEGGEDDHHGPIIVTGVVAGAHQVHGGDYPDGDC